MNICHVITRLIIGGAQENTLLSCRGLAERGHRVTLIAGTETGPEGSLWDEARTAGCDLIELPVLRRAVRPWHDLKASIRLQEIFSRLRPDVVHTHSSKAGILGRAAAHAAGVPAIIHTIHGMSFNRTQHVLTRALYRTLERWMTERTTAFITVAEAMIDQAVTAGLGSRDRFQTIYSAMDTDAFQPDGQIRESLRRAWGVHDGDVVVGTIARLFDHKGYEEIIAAMPQALAREPRLRFVWVGDGANRPRYESQLNRLGLRDRVTLLGLIPPREVARVLNGFDILLHASRWEGLPRAVVQGLLMQVPAISFDNDGAPEVVIPGETGNLVRLGDVAGLVDAVVSLAADPDARRSMGHRGRELCLDRFSPGRMIDALEALYQRVS